MRGDDSPDGSRARAHDDRLGLDVIAVTRTPRKRSPARHAGRGDEHVVARDEVVGREHAVDVEAGGLEALVLVLVARPELPASRRRGT